MNEQRYNEHNPYLAPSADLGNHDDYFEYDTTPFYKASGRIGRVRFLAYYMLLGLCMLPVMMIAGILMAVLMPFSQELAFGMVAVAYIGMMIFSLYAMFAPSIRRLNDLNKTGWISLLYLVPIANLLLILYLLVARGDEGVNDYGAPAEPPSTVMTVLAVVLPILFVAWLGIVMAIALPAYQDYVERAQTQNIEQEMLRMEQQMQSMQDNQNQ